MPLLFAVLLVVALTEVEVLVAGVDPVVPMAAATNLTGPTSYGVL